MITLACIFCGKKRPDVRTLIVADASKEDTPAICNECIMLSVAALDDVQSFRAEDKARIKAIAAKLDE